VVVEMASQLKTFVTNFTIEVLPEKSKYENLGFFTDDLKLRENFEV